MNVTELPRPTSPSELQIGPALLPDALTPEVERECKRQFGGQVPNVFKVLAPVRWMVDLYNSAMRRTHSVIAPRELLDLAVFVACQEASCRYCYGGMRAFMRMLGYPERRLRAIENRVELDELTALDRAAIDFASALVRMAKPPGEAERSALEKLGLQPLQIAELAFAVAQVVASTRITMLLAVQPDEPFERMPQSFLFGRLLRPFIARGFASETRPLADVAGGPFADLLEPLGRTWGAQILRASIDELLGSGPIPVRTKLLLFLVLGAATGARTLRESAATLLAESGFSRSLSDEVTAHLASPSLDALEAKLVPLARDTVFTRPISIQPRVREATAGLDPRAILDVVGAIAVGNALARIATLS